MTELVTSGSVGGMASNGCLYPEVRPYGAGRADARRSIQTLDVASS
jgi:hypothetical protein